MFMGVRGAWEENLKKTYPEDLVLRVLRGFIGEVYTMSMRAQAEGRIRMLTYQRQEAWRSLEEHWRANAWPLRSVESLTGGGLDQLAEGWAGMRRTSGETDEALRGRILARFQDPEGSGNLVIIVPVARSCVGCGEEVTLFPGRWEFCGVCLTDREFLLGADAAALDAEETRCREARGIRGRLRRLRLPPEAAGPYGKVWIDQP